MSAPVNQDHDSYCDGCRGYAEIVASLEAEQDKWKWVAWELTETIFNCTDMPPYGEANRFPETIIQHLLARYQPQQERAK